MGHFHPARRRQPNVAAAPRDERIEILRPARAGIDPGYRTHLGAIQL